MNVRLSTGIVLTVLIILVASLSAGAQTPYASRAIEGQAVSYYNGASRVDLVLVLDELAVSEDTDAAGAARRVAASRAEGNRIRYQVGAADTAQLEQRARVLRGMGFNPRAVLYLPNATERADRFRQTLTDRVAVKVKNRAEESALLERFGLSVLERPHYAPDAAICRVTQDSVTAALEAANGLYETGAVEFATPILIRPRSPRLTPDDPLFADQWHLKNTGQTGGNPGDDVNIQDAWDIATGVGVNIAIFDDGVQIAHPDLAPNVRGDLDYDFENDDGDPTPDLSSSYHGTACAGIAAARGNNGLGVTGAAYEAGLVGLLMDFYSAEDPTEAEGLRHQADATDPADYVHINSNSWGPYDDGKRIETFGPLARAAVEYAIEYGRGGLGTVFTWAAGNGRSNNDNVNYDGYASSRYTIAVGATGADGAYSWYSEPGASMLVNAPSSYTGGGTTTTDLMGEYGYNKSTSENGGDYTNSFGGTSSACPLAAGIVALMLETNPGLTWRDVQHVLVETTQQNDPADAGWFTNGAGYLFNHAYGFGRIDAAAAVAFASVWSNAPDAALPLSASNATIHTIPPDGSPLTRTMSLTGSPFFVTEQVEVTVDIAHPRRGDLEIAVISPDGTRSQLAEEHGDDGQDYSNWMFTTVACWGEDPRGDWTLEIVDAYPDEYDGVLNSWSLAIHGFEAPACTGITSDNIGPLSGNALFEVSFNQPVVNFDNGDDLEITATGTVSYENVSFSGGPSVYTVNFSGVYGDGDLLFSVATDSDVSITSGYPVQFSATSPTVTVLGTQPEMPVSYALGLVALMGAGAWVLRRRRN